MAEFSDKDIAAAVRKLLVKNWVDVSKVRMRVTSGLLTLTGTIEKVYGAEGGPVDPKFLSAVDHALQGVKGLRRVRFQFTNWTKDGGEWVAPVG
jgi:hypothetical protein